MKIKCNLPRRWFTRWYYGESGGSSQFCRRRADCHSVWCAALACTHIQGVDLQVFRNKDPFDDRPSQLLAYHSLDRNGSGGCPPTTAFSPGNEVPVVSMYQMCLSPAAQVVA